MGDLIIGGASNYEWSLLRFWVGSIIDSGFSGDIVVVGSNIDSKTKRKLKQYGVEVINHPQSNVPHVDRFYYIWKFLHESEKKYDNVITTDTKDVLFQSNPSEWLKTNNCNLVLSPEGMYYQDEPWNRQNAIETFGAEWFDDWFKNKPIYNVGVIAGKTEHVKSLMILLFQMSQNRPVKIVDQAVYNFLITNMPQSGNLYTTNKDGWCAHMGVSMEAIKSGAGHVGQLYRGLQGLTLYNTLYNDEQPLVQKNGLVTRVNKVPYVICHQWNRIPNLRNTIIEKMENKYE